MKKKTRLRVLLLVLVAVFLWVYFAPEAPQAPVVQVGNVVERPVPQNLGANEADDGDTQDEDVQDEDLEELEDDTVEDEGEVEVVLPESPLSDSSDVEEFNGEVAGNGTLYELVPGSQVDWIGRKVGGQHNGVVDITDGQLYVEGGEIVEGLFVMDMTSINATDIDNDGLDGHIKEWFNTEEHPTAEFFLTEASSTQVIGVLTLNGQSREISFPATVIVEDDTVIANADFALDRTQWGVDGGLAASSEFMELSLNLTWTAQ